MAQAYIRQSTFADGDTITAALFNDEYNQLVNAFAYSSSSASSTGHSHDGTAILARYTTPDYDYGDLGTLKTLHYLRVSMATEGIVEPDVQIKFDYNSTDVPQPTDLFDLGVINPPS